jgi:hypothetical protein
MSETSYRLSTPHLIQLRAQVSMLGAFWILEYYMFSS